MIDCKIETDEISVWLVFTYSGFEHNEEAESTSFYSKQQAFDSIDQFVDEGTLTESYSRELKKEILHISWLPDLTNALLARNAEKTQFLGYQYWLDNPIQKIKSYNHAPKGRRMKNLQKAMNT